MLSLCRRYVGQSDEAEDLLHDGFLQIFSQIGKFTWRGEGTLAAWVRRVMTNHVLSALEKEKRLATDDIDEVPDMGADDNDAPPDISTDVIMQLIAELPTGYRTVLNLFLVEGRSPRRNCRKTEYKGKHFGFAVPESEEITERQNSELHQSERLMNHLDNWEDNLRHRLSDFRTPPPAMGWEKLEKALNELPVAPPVPSSKPRPFYLRPWFVSTAVSAAACLTVALLLQPSEPLTQHAAQQVASVVKQHEAPKPTHRPTVAQKVSAPAAASAPTLAHSAKQAAPEAAMPATCRMMPQPAGETPTTC